MERQEVVTVKQYQWWMQPAGVGGRTSAARRPAAIDA